MISLNTLARDLQAKLNDNEAGFTFNIVTDTGELKAPTRNGNTVIAPINGILTSTGSDVTNLVDGNGGENQSLLYATQNCTLRVIMSLPDTENDIEIPEENGLDADVIAGYSTRIESLRAVLNSVFQGVINENLTDANGKTYSTTTVYQFVASGQREMVSFLGDSFSFYCYITYFFVQNGVNTRDMTFTLDGSVIPYQSVTCYRTPTMDGNVYANTKNGATRNISAQSNFNVSFELPAMVEPVTNQIFSYILDGALNRAHLLHFKLNNQERDYLVTFGENSIMGETIKNAGLRLSLVEAPDEYELINFGKNYWIYQATSGATQVQVPDGTQVYLFGNDNGFLTAVNGVATANISTGNYLVSTAKLTSETGFEIIQSGV